MRLLVVCLGNICRSPMAEGALRERIRLAGLAELIEVDSAGTGGWHRGEPPDPRAIRCARGHGVDISGSRARQLRAQDYLDFDWLLCADADNHREVLRLAPAAQRDKVALWLPWAGGAEVEAIPDPYAGGEAEFERVWSLVDGAARGTVRRLTEAR
ncbi:MAG TPA: phosphotyrosine protein phosphatase [Xanthomonadaceae bacterium]|nr:phosphotyrosine protein phosphatase [Xanthomonadaceae bacterium]